MPRLDGLKLVALVRQGGPRQGMPIVVITTESAGADGRRALELGADAWLEKPVDPRRLVEVVRGLLGGPERGAGEAGSRPGVDGWRRLRRRGWVARRGAPRAMA